MLFLCRSESVCELPLEWLREQVPYLREPPPNNGGKMFQEQLDA